MAACLAAAAASRSGHWWSRTTTIFRGINHDHRSKEHQVTFAGIVKATDDRRGCLVHTRSALALGDRVSWLAPSVLGPAAPLSHIEDRRGQRCDRVPPERLVWLPIQAPVGSVVRVEHAPGHQPSQHSQPALPLQQPSHQSSHQPCPSVPSLGAEIQFRMTDLVTYAATPEEVIAACASGSQQGADALLLEHPAWSIACCHDDISADPVAWITDLVSVAREQGFTGRCILWRCVVTARRFSAA